MLRWLQFSNDFTSKRSFESVALKKRPARALWITTGVLCLSKVEGQLFTRDVCVLALVRTRTRHIYKLSRVIHIPPEVFILEICRTRDL